MENKEFNSGETVRLKSGGPIMTTGGYNFRGVICKWFDKNNNPKSECFSEESLVRAEVSTESWSVY